MKDDTKAIGRLGKMWVEQVCGRKFKVHFEHLELRRFFNSELEIPDTGGQRRGTHRVREINLSINSIWRCLKPWDWAWGEIEIDKEIKNWAGGTPIEFGEKRQNHQETEEQPVRQENRDLTQEDKSLYLFFYSKINSKDLIGEMFCFIFVSLCQSVMFFLSWLFFCLNKTWSSFSWGKWTQKKHKDR